MSHILHSAEPLEEKADTLIRMANQNGGEDNITVVILGHGAESGSG